VTVVQWKDRLEEKVGGLQSVQEVLIARQCWDSGLSVHLTQKAIEDRRKGISQ